MVKVAQVQGLPLMVGAAQRSIFANSLLTPESIQSVFKLTSESIQRGRKLPQFRGGRIADKLSLGVPENG
jgi:hypothetical protein